MPNIVDVNGVKYVLKEEKKPRTQLSPTLTALAMMAGSFGNYSFGNSNKEPERPRVDIVKEYGLIQLKKSCLSKSQRDWVVYEFERNFIKLEDTIIKVKE